MGGGECGARARLAGARPRRPAHGEVVRGGAARLRLWCSGGFHRAVLATWNASTSWGSEKAFCALWLKKGGLEGELPWVLSMTAGGGEDGRSSLILGALVDDRWPKVEE